MTCWPRACWKYNWYDGKHPACAWLHDPYPRAELDEAVRKARVDQLVEILAAHEPVVLNSERQAVQVWSACVEGQLDAHLPLPTEVFEALVLAQEQ